jgi:histidinol-phosphate phosphatase family protein
MALNLFDVGPLPAAGRPAVFLDKDGTLVEDVPYNVDPALLRFTEQALPALRLLQQQGYPLIIISNQPGIAHGYFDQAALDRLADALTARLREQGITLAGFYACPHAPPEPGEPGCSCRKPQPGLLRRAALDHGIDLTRSWMVGDILNDVEAGRRAGCKTVLMDVGNETEWDLAPLRQPHFRARQLMDAALHILEADARLAGPAAQDRTEQASGREPDGRALRDAVLPMGAAHLAAACAPAAPAAAL